MFRRPKNAAPLNTNGTLVGVNGRFKSEERRKARVSTLKSSKDSKYNKTGITAKKSMYHIVVLPDKPMYYIEDYSNEEERSEISEWWAENTVDFLNELQLIYGVLSEGNEEWKMLCENATKNVQIGYPSGVAYKWKSSRDAKPKQLPVDSYIEHVLFWVNAQIENEDIFPTDDEIPFPDNFKNYLKKMFQRMFRIFAIIHSNPCLSERKDVDNTLEPCFKHFLYFAWKWELLDAKETKCIDKVTGTMRHKFDRDEKLYRNQQLPLEA